MNKRVLCGLFAGLLTTGLPAMEVHWYEAENFKGNPAIISDASASGGKCLKGGSYYEFARKIPLNLNPGQTLNIWARVKSEVPANWFMMRADKKAYNFFSSDKDQWQWVLVGKISEQSAKSDKNIMPSIFLQLTKGTKPTSVTGYMDAVVITEMKTAAELEQLMKAKNSTSDPKTQIDAKLLSQLANQRRITECPVLVKAPVLDGKLDDAAWQKAARLDHFMKIAGSDFAAQQTIVRIGRDAENLYLAAELKEQKLPFIRKTKTKKNDSVWTDDCLEIFLDPGLMQRDPHQLTVNALGTRQDNLARRIDEAWFSSNKRDWKAATSIGKDAWFVEVQIPWKLLAEHLPENGSAWGFNVCRNQSPDNELSYWNNTGEFFSRAEGFGILAFSDLAAKPQGISFDTVKNEVTYSFSKGDPDISVTANLSLNSNPIFKTEKNLPASDAPVAISFPVKADKVGTYTISSLIQEKNRANLSFDLRMKTYSRGIVSSVWPAEERGNVLHLLDGTVQQCFFVAGNHGKKALARPTLQVAVPQDIEILDPSTSDRLPFYFQVGAPVITDIERDGQAYRQYEFKFAKDLYPAHLSKQLFHNSVLLYFKNRGEVTRETVKKIYYRLSSGKEIEEEQSFDLKLLPAFPGKQPKLYTIHNWLWTLAPSPANWPDAIKTQAQVGFNSVEAAQVVSDPAYYAEIRANNLSIYNNTWWHWTGKEYTQENAAICFDGKKHPKMICPTVLLENNAALFRKIHAIQFQNAKEKLMDGLIWDLEGPAAWEYCFCPRCIESFREWAGLPAGKLTPESIRRDHSKEWVRFACHQSALLGKAFRDGIREVRPDGKYGIYSAVPSFSTMETYRVDWASMMKYTDIALPSYYSDNESVLDTTFTSEMKNVIREIRSAANHPIQIWATLTAGYGRNATISPTAALVKMQILRSIASGMDGVTFWWWGPFDGLYYRKTAEATRLISDFEDYFKQGEKGSSVKVNHSNGLRMSTFITRKDGLDFILIFNHNSKGERTATIQLDKPLNSYRYPDGRKISDGSSFQVTVPPLDVTVILCGEGDSALKKINNTMKSIERNR